MAIKTTNIDLQKAYDDVVSPATIANTILDEVKGFNPFTLLKPSFWYCLRVFFGFFFLSQMLNGVKTIPWIKGQASSRTLKKLKKGKMWGADRCSE
jgi:hypothetical protein